MKKYSRVLLAAGVLGLPVAAVADNSSVEIFGYLDVSFDAVKALGATTPGSDLQSRTLVSSNLSMLGFRGSEDLGGGTKAIFQVLNLIPFDTGGGTWASRDSWVGLSGEWGVVQLGRANSPYKLSTIGLDPFGDAWYGGIASYDNIIGSSYGPGGGGGFPWDLVTGNMVQYASPKLGGLSASIQYSANEGKTATTNPSAYSGAVVYDSGPLYLSYGYEKHKDLIPGISVGFAGPGTNSTDTANKIGVGFTFGATTLSGLYERLKYEQAGTAITELRHDNYMVAVKHVIGPHILRASYLKAKSATNAPDTGAKQFALGYGYTLSKRTEIFAAWAKLTNEAAAGYSPLTFVLNKVATPTGADPNMLSVGIHHNF